MGRLYVPSTPASRGEEEPEGTEETPLSLPEVQAAAAALGYDLVPVTPPEPAGNASRETWASYAVDVKGAKPEDLVDSDGKELARDELKAKYGTPAAE